MMRLSSTILVAFLLYSALGTSGCTAPSDSCGAKEMLPMPGFAEGWRSDGGVRLYTKNTLFEHINGEAELYFPYGFVVVATTRYERTGGVAGRYGRHRVAWSGAARKDLLAEDGGFPSGHHD